MTNLEEIIQKQRAWADSKIAALIADGKTATEARHIIYPDEVVKFGGGFDHVRDANAQAFAAAQAAHESGRGDWPGSCDADD